MSVLNDNLIRTIYGEPGTAIAVAYTDSSAASTNPLTVGTTYCLTATTDCHIVFATSPTATTSHMVLKAGFDKFVTMSNAYRIAAIRASESGTLTATPMIGYRV